MTKKTITRSEYLQLMGLVAVGREHYGWLERIRASIEKLLEISHHDPGDGRCVSDVVFANGDVDHMLEDLNIAAEPE
jgi:hypothetical protein